MPSCGASRTVFSRSILSDGCTPASNGPSAVAGRPLSSVGTKDQRPGTRYRRSTVPSNVGCGTRHRFAALLQQCGSTPWTRGGSAAAATVPYQCGQSVRAASASVRTKRSGMPVAGARRGQSITSVRTSGRSAPCRSSWTAPTGSATNRQCGAGQGGTFATICPSGKQTTTPPELDFCLDGRTAHPHRSWSGEDRKDRAGDQHGIASEREWTRINEIGNVQLQVVPIRIDSRPFAVRPFLSGPTTATPLRRSDAARGRGTCGRGGRWPRRRRRCGRRRRPRRSCGPVRRRGCPGCTSARRRALPRCRRRACRR